MRVSLQIDGDASGAAKAASDASGAVTDLGKQTDAISHAIEDGFKNSIEALEALKNKSQAAGAANDNTAGSALGLAGKLSQVAGAALGADNALAKGASGAVNFAKGVGDAVRAVGTFNVIGAVLGLAVTAASTFYGVINSGSGAASKALDEQARQVGIVRDAYSDAAKTAGEFLTQSKNVTLFQAQQNLISLKAEQLKQVTPLVAGNSFQPQIPQAFGGEAAGGFDFANAAKDIGPFQKAVGDLFTSIGLGAPELANAAENIRPFQKAIDDLHTSIALGTPDFAAYQDAIAAVGRAAQGANPALAAQAAELLNNAQKAADASNAVKKQEAMLAQLSGTATDAQKKLLGISTATDTGAGSFDRLSRAMDRQSAAQAAEAQTAGLSAGAIARLRAEVILGEAANQSGAGGAAKYAAEIKGIADRAGEAAQKLALARLQSDAAFNRDQIGRTAIDASVADQLRGAVGNNADLNGTEASAIRLNETMKELKGTTQEVATGAFRDFRTELQNGTNVWEAFGKAGVNALNRIIDKLADKAFDKLITGAIGSFLGVGGTGTVANGGIVLGGAGGPGVFAAAGGGSFGPGWGVVGEQGPEIIKVHAGGVTVYPHQVSKPYLPGFADGGSLSPWGNVSRLPRGGQDNQASGSPMQLQVSVGVTVDENGNLKAYVKNVSTQAATDGISDFVGSQAFGHHVANAVVSGKSDGLI
jgi:hypothetical protein